MLEMRYSELSEMTEQSLEINNFCDIKPESEITVQECKNFWDKLFDSDILSKKQDVDKDDISGSFEKDNLDKKGGSYAEIFKEGEGQRYEVHHMPADSASNLERNDGPAIKMEKEDHRQTASCGSSRETREYRTIQKDLIEQGKFREAVQMDIDDIHEKFGDKYNEGIAQMLDYVDKLEMEGKIDG